MKLIALKIYTNKLLGGLAKKHDVMTILKHYIEASMWTEEEELGQDVTSDDIDRASIVSAVEDIKAFMDKAGPLMNNLDDSQIGHDLWLTRNGHGTGFWDRGLDEIGENLSEIAKKMGSKHFYRGDDGKIYIE